MKTTMLLTLLTLSLSTLNATEPHYRETPGPQTPDERAFWKESRIAESELACDCCGGGGCGGSRDKDKDHRVYVSKPSHTVTSSHPGSIYYIVHFNFNIGEITMADGSIWRIRHDDRYQSMGWLKTDEISILPNTNFFSFYDYKLLNRVTGAEIEVNLYKQPVLGAAYTRQIMGVNDTYTHIYLTDGSAWSISPNDEYLYQKWMIGDIIMIGVNTDTDAYIRPNILINATHHTYIRATWIQ